MSTFNQLKKSQRVKTLIWNIKKVFYFFQDLIFVFFCVFYNLLRFKKIHKKETVVVTAASEDYFTYLMNLLKSISKFNFTKIVVYDLGLTSKQVSQLQDKKNIEVVKFNFSKFPSFVSEKQESNENKIGAYSWKAAIIKEVVYMYKMQVIWLDSANLITKQFTFLRIALTSLGYFTTYSKDTVQKWTHESVIKKLNLDSRLLKKVNLNAAIIGFDYNNKLSRKLLDDWYDYCLQKDLISPENSSKENHRWDQSLLTIIFYKIKLPFIPKLHNFYGVKTHQWEDRIFYIVQTENPEDLTLRENWYKNYGYLSTNTFKDAKKVIFLNLDSFIKFPKRRLLNKVSYVFLEKQKEIAEVNLNKLLNSKIKIRFLVYQDLNLSDIPENIDFELYSQKTIENIKQYTK